MRQLHNHTYKSIFDKRNLLQNTLFFFGKLSIRILGSARPVDIIFLRYVIKWFWLNLFRWLIIFLCDCYSFFSLKVCKPSDGLLQTSCTSHFTKFKGNWSVVYRLYTKYSPLVATVDATTSSLSKTPFYWPFIVTIQAQKKAPPDMQLLQSVYMDVNDGVNQRIWVWK